MAIIHYFVYQFVADRSFQMLHSNSMTFSGADPGICERGFDHVANVGGPRESRGMFLGEI